MKKHLNFYRGTIINYYFVCHTKLWLFVNRLNLEDNSEDVRIGKVLHELNEDKDSEVSIENIKVDKTATATSQLLYRYRFFSPQQHNLL